MKQVAILMSAVLSLTLFSFIAGPDNGITKKGANLYEVAPLAKSKVSQADKDAFIAIVKKEYKLDDAAIKKGVVLASTSRASFSVISKKLSPDDWFETKCWSDALATPGNGQNLVAILSKYAAKPTDK
jgi:hypothetical protein